MVFRPTGLKCDGAEMLGAEYAGRNPLKIYRDGIPNRLSDKRRRIGQDLKQPFIESNVFPID